LHVALNEVKEQDIYLPMQGYQSSSPSHILLSVFLTDLTWIRLRTHPEGIHALWTFAQENWDTLVKKLPPGLSMLGSVVQIVTNNFSSFEAVDQVEAFFRGKSTKGFDQGLAQSLDSVRAKAAWVERDAGEVKAWLSERGFVGKTKPGEKL
jgi:aminopeptidase 2